MSIPAEDEAEDTRRRPAVVDRVTVSLVAKAAGALAALRDRTGLSQTDITNRAITLYEFVDAQLRAGNDLLIRDPRTGDTHLVRLL